MMHRLQIVHTQGVMESVFCSRTMVEAVNKTRTRDPVQKTKEYGPMGKKRIWTKRKQKNRVHILNGGWSLGEITYETAIPAASFVLDGVRFRRYKSNF